MAGNVKLQTRIETKLLNKRLKEFARVQGKPVWKVIREAVLWFTQSAVKNTPPRKGQAKKNRPELSIYDLQIKAPTLRNRGIIRQLNSEGDFKFRIPYRNTRKRGGALYAKTMTEARRKAKIKYRYAGKFGWVIAATKALKQVLIGNGVKLKVSPELAHIGTAIGEGTDRKITKWHRMFILRNQSYEVGRYARYGALNALNKTNNRVKRATNVIKREYKKLWNKV